jgi:hypothetical protein
MNVHTGYLTFTKENVPSSVMIDDDNGHGSELYYCLQGRMVTAVHNVTQVIISSSIYRYSLSVCLPS